MDHPYSQSYLPLSTDEQNALNRVKHFPHDGFLAMSRGKAHYAYGVPGLLGLSRNRYSLACAFFVSIGGLTCVLACAQDLVVPLSHDFLTMKFWLRSGGDSKYSCHEEFQMAIFCFTVSGRSFKYVQNRISSRHPGQLKMVQPPF